jgi:hypothetical protein
LLHLLGYDHERSRAEARRMFAREHQLAAALASRNGVRLENGDGCGRDSNPSNAETSRRAFRRLSALPRSRPAN